MIHDNLLMKPLELKDGYLEIPKGPGLGLELDERKIESYRSREG
jgi:muconate cycloisomerase